MTVKINYIEIPVKNVAESKALFHQAFDWTFTDYGDDYASINNAGIDGGLFRDVYVALGDPLEDGAWAIRVHYKPFVRWIWLGALFMALGGILAMMDKRYRVKKVVKSHSLSNQEAQVATAKPSVQAVSELS